MVYDIIITGYGAAGLSMLHHILHTSLKGKSILILDDSSKKKTDKTWCFWEAEKPPYKCANKFYWNKMTVESSDLKVTKDLKKNTYYHIRSEDLTQEVNGLALLNKNVHFADAEVKDLITRKSHVEVKTDNEVYLGKYVVNSIPNLNSNERVKYNLTQNFLGWKVETNTPVFDPNTVTLMDFRGGSDEASFFYILPYSKHYALVEFTRFSEKTADIAHYETNLHNYLKNQLGIQDYQVLYTEYGAIPMTDFSYQRKLSERVFQLGTAGGDTKSTTGYTFKQIQRSCKQIIEAITTGCSLTSNRSRFDFYDGLLLNIIAQRPALTEKIMLSLFNNNDFDDVFRFLDEETNLLQDLKIFKGLPWPPFIKMLLSSKQALYETLPKNIGDSTEHQLVQNSRG